MANEHADRIAGKLKLCVNVIARHLQFAPCDTNQLGCFFGHFNGRAFLNPLQARNTACETPRCLIDGVVVYDADHVVRDRQCRSHHRRSCGPANTWPCEPASQRPHRDRVLRNGEVLLCVLRPAVERAIALTAI